MLHSISTFRPLSTPSPRNSRFSILAGFARFAPSLIALSSSGLRSYINAIFLLSMSAASPKSSALSVHNRPLMLSSLSLASSSFIKRLSMPTKTFSSPVFPFTVTSLIPSKHTNFRPSIVKLSYFGPARIEPPPHIRRTNGGPGVWPGSVPSGRSLSDGRTGLT